MNSHKSLINQMAELDKLIAQARASESKEALAKIHELIREFGFTAQQVFPWQPTKKTVVAKYIDPASGATWTGRGKPPRWISGRDRSQFEVKITEPAVSLVSQSDGKNPFPVH